MEERSRDQAASRLLRHRDPGFLHHRRLEIAPHQARESLSGTRRAGAGGDGLARHRALQHLQAGVGRAVAVVEGHQLVRQLLRRVNGRGRRDDQGPADDHGAPSHLERADCTFRHPAVIAALSGLEHLRVAARLELPLVRGGLGR